MLRLIASLGSNNEQLKSNPCGDNEQARRQARCSSADGLFNSNPFYNIIITVFGPSRALRKADDAESFSNRLRGALL